LAGAGAGDRARHRNGLSQRLPTVTSKQLVKVLERAGWQLSRTSGSHHYFVHPDKRRAVVVPVHPGDLKRPLVAGVLRDAEISREEFVRLL
jgi:predicted RNA binding protein YcfA (HicA-like mRNA interferase family)